MEVLNKDIKSNIQSKKSNYTQILQLKDLLLTKSKNLASSKHYNGDHQKQKLIIEQFINKINVMSIYTSNLFEQVLNNSNNCAFEQIICKLEIFLKENQRNDIKQSVVVEDQRDNSQGNIIKTIKIQNDVIKCIYDGFYGYMDILKWQFLKDFSTQQFGIYDKLYKELMIKNMGNYQQIAAHSGKIKKIIRKNNYEVQEKQQKIQNKRISQSNAKGNICKSIHNLISKPEMDKLRFSIPVRKEKIENENKHTQLVKNQNIRCSGQVIQKRKESTTVSTNRQHFGRKFCNFVKPIIVSKEIDPFNENSQPVTDNSRKICQSRLPVLCEEHTLTNFVSAKRAENRFSFNCQSIRKEQKRISIMKNVEIGTFDQLGTRCSIIEQKYSRIRKKQRIGGQALEKNNKISEQTGYSRKKSVVIKFFQIKNRL